MSDKKDNLVTPGFSQWKGSPAGEQTNNGVATELGNHPARLVNALRKTFKFDEDAAKDSLIQDACKSALNNTLILPRKLHDARHSPIKNSQPPVAIDDVIDLHKELPARVDDTLDLINFNLIHYKPLTGRIRANFTGSTLANPGGMENANFKNSVGVRACIRTEQINNSSFQNTDLRGSKWLAKTISNTDFSHAKLSEAQFNDTHFNYQTSKNKRPFDGVDLESTRFIGHVSFTNVDFTGVTGVSEDTFGNNVVFKNCACASEGAAGDFIREKIADPKCRAPAASSAPAISTEPHIHNTEHEFLDGSNVTTLPITQRIATPNADTPKHPDGTPAPNNLVVFPGASQNLTPPDRINTPDGPDKDPSGDRNR